MTIVLNEIGSQSQDESENQKGADPEQKLMNVLLAHGSDSAPF